LRVDLNKQVTAEMEVTVQIAVCLASKMPVQQIRDTLGCSDLDVKIAKQRLEMVASSWSD
jgi:hypothetical protein